MMTRLPTDLFPRQHPAKIRSTSFAGSSMTGRTLSVKPACACMCCRTPRFSWLAVQRRNRAPRRSQEMLRRCRPAPRDPLVALYQFGPAQQLAAAPGLMTITLQAYKPVCAPFFCRRSPVKFPSFRQESSMLSGRLVSRDSGCTHLLSAPPVIGTTRYHGIGLYISAPNHISATGSSYLSL